jgi:acetolactate synthase I/II/III large subunit
MAPVLLSLDAELQENPIAEPDGLRIPKLAKVVPPEADSGAVAELAKMLVAAESPVMVCDRLARTPAGMAHLVELAETLQCAVVDVGGRMNFPSRHPLNHSFGRAVINQADVIVGLEMNDFWGAVNSFTDRIVRTSRSTIRKGAKLVTLGTRDLLIKSNYQDFGRYQEVDLAIVGDGETSLPALTEAVKRLIDGGAKSAYEARGKKLGPVGVARAGEVQRNRRLGCEPDLGRPPVHGGLRSDQGRGLVIGRRQHRQYLAAPAVELRQGASLERRQRGWRCRIYFAGFARRGARQQAARTADRFHRGRWRLHVCARHALDRCAPPHPDAVCRAQQPCLSPRIHAPAAMAGRRSRGVTNTYIGTTLQDPNIDYAAAAKAFGVHGEGPVSDPNDLAPALKRAIAMVKSGQPALLDVVTEPR